MFSGIRGTLWLPFNSVKTPAVLIPNIHITKEIIVDTSEIRKKEHIKIPNVLQRNLRKCPMGKPEKLLLFFVAFG